MNIETPTELGNGCVVWLDHVLCLLNNLVTLIFFQIEAETLSEEKQDAAAGPSGLPAPTSSDSEADDEEDKEPAPSKKRQPRAPFTASQAKGYKRENRKIYKVKKLVNDTVR